MALILDEHARAAIARRRARGRDGTLFLRVECLRGRCSLCKILTVSWAPRRWPHRPLVRVYVDDLLVVTDRRIARYTQWRNMVITAWCLGPLTRLVVWDEPLVLLEMEEWEYSHPAYGWSAPERGAPQAAS